MIKRIYIDNYKCLVNFELNLRETVLLLGASGSGKTAVLDVVYAVRKLVAGDIRIDDRVAFHPSTLTRWQTCHTQTIELDVDAAGCSFHYRLEVEHEGDSTGPRIVEEYLVGDGKTLSRFDRGTAQLYKDDGSEGPTFGVDWKMSVLARVAGQRREYALLTAFKDALSEVVVCSVDPSCLRALSSGEEPSLSRHAENFVDWYRYVLERDPRSISRHIEAMAGPIDGLEGIDLAEVGPDARVLHLDFSTAGGRYQIPFDELSDGERALFVLYAFRQVTGRRSSGVRLFIDEPENYVPLPEVQPWLMALVELCEETPSQVVISSCHPESIDYLGPDHGLMLRREASGVTRVRPIAELASDSGLRLSRQVARGWI